MKLDGLLLKENSNETMIRTKNERDKLELWPLIVFDNYYGLANC